MAKILTLRHERVDDIPLIIGLANQLRLAEILDRHLGTHGLQEGLNNGQLAVGWLAYILSQADHRKSAVREWANSLSHTLGQLLGQPIRDVEFSDDRLGGLLRRLSDDEAWEASEQDLWAATVAVYALELTGIRLDSTTSYGYHEVTQEGVMQFGPSKDHRPDLPQLKLMAAAAEPSGHLLACDVVPGQCADDPLYTPLIQRVRQIVGRTGLLYAGDCKMAALSTRAELVAHGDYYVMPLPLTGETAVQFERWVDAIVDGPQAATLLWDAGRLLGAGYEFERPLSATVAGQSVRWTERVQVVRSLELARHQQATLEKHLVAAEAELRAVTPAPGRGKRQIRAEAALQAAIASVLARHHVAGLLTVTWERHETTVTRYVGRGRGGPDRSTRTAVQGRYVITDVQRHGAAIAARQHQLGWRVQVTNALPDQLSLPQAVVHYRGGWSLERDFHLVKDLPLGLSPLFVWKEDQIKGLTRLLTLALRLMTLLETAVRRGLEYTRETVAGLYEGQPTRRTDRPTGKRILQAFARAQITLTHAQVGAVTFWHLTPLTSLHEQLLWHLQLPASLYTALAYNSS
jgi:transposase